MSDIYISPHADPQAAAVKKNWLEMRGYSVEVKGPSDNVTLDSSELDGGCVAGCSHGWVVIGEKA